MEIAIIGGGAAGMITAYLLDGAHRVTVYERQPILGGNIRTLGRNVAVAGLPEGVFLDSGVIEFSPERFTKLHRLFAELAIELRPVPAATGLCLADGRVFASQGKIAGSRAGALVRLREALRLARLLPALHRFRRRAGRARADELAGRRLDEVLGDGVLDEWLRLLMVYAYSIPRDQVGAMPAALTIPTLHAFTGDVSWTSVVGGIYRYIEAILARLRGEVVTSAIVDELRRDEAGVHLRLRGAEPRRFDAVVIATTPERVLELLSDPSEAEVRRFAAWRGNDVDAVIHTDSGLYRRRGIVDYSEFDLFEDPPGYNAYLNRLCGIDPARGVDYHFSYNLEREIDPAKILHVQPHRTPLYTVDAYAELDAIRGANGERRTYFAGAWLGDGLHEGAVRSALAVSERLGGRSL